MTDNQRHEQHRRREWRDRAACRDGDVDPELFFPAAESGPARDAQVRGGEGGVRPVPGAVAECLTEALARIPYGIAGGLTEHERRRLRRDHTTRTAGSRRGDRRWTRCSPTGHHPG